MKIPLIERQIDRIFQHVPQPAGMVPAGKVLDDMTARDALRFLHHQSLLCRDRDSHEALCLLLPALIRVFGLPPMTVTEAGAFKEKFRRML